VIHVDMRLTGRNIEDLMDRRHLSVKDVAEEMMVSTRAVRMWLSGDRLPNYDNLARMSISWKVPINKILEIVET